MRSGRTGLRTIVAIVAGATPGTVGAESMTRAVGGQGGTRFELRCGEPSYVLRGLNMRMGSWIDAVQPTCLGTTTPRVASGAGIPNLPWRGGTGGASGYLACREPLYAVRGLRVATGMLTDRIRGVTGVALVCGRANGRRETASGGEHFRERKPRALIEDVMCPNGEVATGIYGWSGRWLDGIGLICSRRRFR